MTLKEQINKDYLTAFKSKDTVAKNLLSVIKGEIQTIEKNTGVQHLADEEVSKILTKTSKSLKEMVASGNEQAKTELTLVETYLPKQMTRDEIKERVETLITQGMSQMGQIMKEFATLPADKKVVSEVFKEVTN